MLPLRNNIVFLFKININAIENILQILVTNTQMNQEKNQTRLRTLIGGGLGALRASSRDFKHL